jgi:hypothetical protein
MAQKTSKTKFKKIAKNGLEIGRISLNAVKYKERQVGPYFGLRRVSLNALEKE